MTRLTIPKFPPVGSNLRGNPVPRQRSVQMSQRDVETEVYERLYGPSRAEPRGKRTARDRVLIGDGEVPTPGGTDGIDRSPHVSPRESSSSRRRRALSREAATLVHRGMATSARVIRSRGGQAWGSVARGRGALRRARPAPVGALDRPRDASSDVPAVEEFLGAFRHRGVVASALLAGALSALTGLVILLSAGATTTQRQTPAAATPRGVPTWQRPQVDPPSRRTHSERTTVSAAEPRSATPPSAPRNRARSTTRRKRSSRAQPGVRRRPTTRTPRTKTPTRGRQPIQQPSRQGSVPPTSTKPPVTTTPAPTGAGSAETGGSSAPPDTTG